MIFSLLGDGGAVSWVAGRLGGVYNELWGICVCVCVGRGLLAAYKQMV